MTSPSKLRRTVRGPKVFNTLMVTAMVEILALVPDRDQTLTT